LISKDTIAKMKDGAIVINTSRGAAIVEADLADALRCGKLKAAAMDVVAKEPIPSDSPLLSAPNCMITPHMAWAPKESRQRIMDCTKRSIEAFLAGKPINRVN
jgi:glycerate dehydrogenase